MTPRDVPPRAGTSLLIRLLQVQAIAIRALPPAAPATAWAPPAMTPRTKAPSPTSSPRPTAGRRPPASRLRLRVVLDLAEWSTWSGIWPLGCEGPRHIPELSEAAYAGGV